MVSVLVVAVESCCAGRCCCSMLVGLRLRYTLYADRVLHYLHTLSTAAAGVGDGYSGSRATALDGAKDGISFGNDMIFFY
jgi:hypothetical protein